MGAFLTPSDFPDIDSGEADTLIDDAEALAILAAPCIADDDLSDHQVTAITAILRGVVLRWNDAGTPVSTQLTAGPFSQTVTPQARRNAFWPSEIRDLQRVCRSGPATAYAVDTAPGLGGTHAPWCSLAFGAAYCSCGADIAGTPIYG